MADLHCRTILFLSVTVYHNYGDKWPNINLRILRLGTHMRTQLQAINSGGLAALLACMRHRTKSTANASHPGSQIYCQDKVSSVFTKISVTVFARRLLIIIIRSLFHLNNTPVE